MRCSSAVVLLAALMTAAAGHSSRFFFSGDGSLTLDHAHFSEQLTVRYRDADGRYDDAALRRIERFFRSRSDGASAPVSLRLIELLDFVADRHRPSRLTLVSGYRSPALNETLRSKGRGVAQSSLHTEGLAADVQPHGVDLRQLWLQLRELRFGGVGLYQDDGFLHLDFGQPRFWEAATSGVEKNVSADNARLFARTDFDRYPDLAGAVVRLHAVTALPIRVQRTALIGERRLTIVPLAAGVAVENDCYVLSEPAERYAFSVTTAAPPPLEPAPIRLRTCAPRVGATAKEIVTNPVERQR
jgi:uncharacterized protein YcbK (DUF882 family)